MLNTRKNYGNFTPEKWQYVHMWGRSKDLFQVVEDGYGDVHVRRAGGPQFFARPSELKLLPDQADAKKRYQAEIKRDQERHQQQQRQVDAAKVELDELKAFLNSNPATHLHGELWDRLRNLSPQARCAFSNSDYRIPVGKWL